MGAPFIIAISGRIGAGKNYLANKLAETYHKQGYTTGETTFAYALKNEATQIITDFKNNHTLEQVASDYNITVEEAETLRNIIAPDLNKINNLTGWVKTEGVRKFLQCLGTDIRRNQRDNYWVEKITEHIPDNVDYVFIPDVRFPNEANKSLDLGGVLLRIEVSDEVILNRVNERDGLKYSTEAIHHKSEHALDDYAGFDHIVGETFDPQWIIDNIITPKQGVQPATTGVVFPVQP